MNSLSLPSYELYVPLHHLWLGYMSELLSLSPPPATVPNNPTMPNSATMHAKLVKADYHRSILSGVFGNAY